MLKIMYMYIRIFKIWTNQSELLNNYRIYIVIKKKQIARRIVEEQI